MVVEAGYLAGNTLSLSCQRARRIRPRVTRYLDRTLWNEVKRHIYSLPKDSPRERERSLRARWLFTLFYLGGLRTSEVRPAMNLRDGFLRVRRTSVMCGRSFRRIGRSSRRTPVVNLSKAAVKLGARLGRIRSPMRRTG
jgi:integrase